jgi:hypothetical protein
MLHQANSQAHPKSEDQRDGGKHPSQDELTACDKQSGVPARFFSVNERRHYLGRALLVGRLPVRAPGSRRGFDGRKHPWFAAIARAGGLRFRRHDAPLKQIVEVVAIENEWTRLIRARNRVHLVLIGHENLSRAGRASDAGPCLAAGNPQELTAI